MSADPRPGAPDGMKVDVQGNVYCTGPEVVSGLWIPQANTWGLF